MPLFSSKKADPSINSLPPSTTPPASDSNSSIPVLLLSNTFTLHAKNFSDILLSTPSGPILFISTRNSPSTPTSPTIKIHSGHVRTSPVAATLEFETAVGDILMNLSDGSIATTALQQTGAGLGRGYVFALEIGAGGDGTAEMLEWRAVRVNRAPAVVGWRLVRAATDQVFMEYMKSKANVSRRMGEAKWTDAAREAGVVEGAGGLLIMASLLGALVKEERLEKSPKVPTRQEINQLGSSWTIGMA